jgi:bifunctional non-homologous end joining protein LigD
LPAVADDKVACYTDTGLDWTDRFTHLVEPARGLAVGSALIDGEVVVLNDEGRADFSTLQEASRRAARSHSMPSTSSLATAKTSGP